MQRARAAHVESEGARPAWMRVGRAISNAPYRVRFSFSATSSCAEMRTLARLHSGHLAGGS
jgi:hypothetical protein